MRRGGGNKENSKDDDAWLIDSKGNLKWLYLLHTQWKTTWLSHLQWKQGLSLPEQWKICTSHHVKGMDDRSSGNVLVHKHKQHQVGLFRHFPHLRRATTEVEEIHQNFVLMPWNTRIFSSEGGQVTNSASTFTVDTTEYKLRRNTCYRYAHRHSTVPL